MKRYTRLLFTKWAQSVVGITISAVFIYFTLPSLHLPEVAQAMRSANYWWILPGVAVYFVGLWVRSWRWHYTLRRIKPVPSLRLFPLVCIGYFGNNVFPFRAGEVLRSVVLRKTEDIAISSSLATVFIERVFDGLVMLLFVFVALPFAPMPPEYRRLVVLLTLLMLGATAVFMDHDRGASSRSTPGCQSPPAHCVAGRSDDLGDVDGLGSLSDRRRARDPPPVLICLRR